VKEIIEFEVRCLGKSEEEDKYFYTKKVVWNYRGTEQQLWKHIEMGYSTYPYVLYRRVK
jgi:hypothetical protein